MNKHKNRFVFCCQCMYYVSDKHCCKKGVVSFPVESTTDATECQRKEYFEERK